ncbi:MAG: uroporphyrinogen-III C-methyltransferase [Burkholderiales bacterium]|nr:uroporphyrinogen-III C-methyltransferase [Burkholderiales bacterium]
MVQEGRRTARPGRSRQRARCHDLAAVGERRRRAFESRLRHHHARARRAHPRRDGRVPAPRDRPDDPRPRRRRRARAPLAGHRQPARRRDGGEHPRDGGRRRLRLPLELHRHAEPPRRRVRGVRDRPGEPELRGAALPRPRDPRARDRRRPALGGRPGDGDPRARGARHAREDDRRLLSRTGDGGVIPEASATLGRATDCGDAAPRGKVCLVGAGPGDPDLLTLRALRLMQQADVVLHDHLVSEAVLALVRADAERIYVGKRERNHALSQEEINALLVRLAGEGKRVLRLKGGDPFMFGRGGEEAEALAEHDIPFEVVPGVTSAAGASSRAGIPLTHRDYAQSCVFVTGHRREGGAQMDWPALARARQTLVIYMGLGMLPEISRRLIAHGRGADTPAAIVERATTAAQRVVAGTLATLPDLAKACGARPPALVIVGEVVALRERLCPARPDALPVRPHRDAPECAADPLTTDR